MRSGWLTVWLLLTAFLWMGCSTAQVKFAQEIPVKIEPTDAVAIVPRSPGSLFEANAVDCISDALKKANLVLRIVPLDEFRHRAFPDANSPLWVVDLILNEPSSRERVVSLGIRYLIVALGTTTMEKVFTEGACGPPGGCVGLAVWDRKSSLTASVWDLKQTNKLAEVEVLTHGRPWAGILALYPIGMPAFTESRACGELGNAVVKLLGGE